MGREWIIQTLDVCEDADHELSLITRDGKPLSRADFLELFDRVGQWYVIHTDEDIQTRCHEADDRTRNIREILRRDDRASRDRPPKPGVVYLLKCGAYYKIGKSLNVRSRKSQLETQLPHIPELIHTIGSPDPTELEHRIHLRFQHKRLNGEWFNLSPEDVETFKTL